MVIQAQSGALYLPSGAMVGPSWACMSACIYMCICPCMSMCMRICMCACVYVHVHVINVQHGAARLASAPTRGFQPLSLKVPGWPSARRAPHSARNRDAPRVHLPEQRRALERSFCCGSLSPHLYALRVLIYTDIFHHPSIAAIAYSLLTKHTCSFYMCCHIVTIAYHVFSNLLRKHVLLEQPNVFEYAHAARMDRYRRSRNLR